MLNRYHGPFNTNTLEKSILEFLLDNFCLCVPIPSNNGFLTFLISLLTLSNTNTSYLSEPPSPLLTYPSLHPGPINALTFSSPPSQTYILTGSSDRSIHLHRVSPPSTSTTPLLTTQPIQRYLAHGYPILSLTCSLSNTTFASSSGDRTSPFLWDVSTATTLRRFGTSSASAHTSRVGCVTFSGSDDSVLISGSDDRSVRLWDTKSRDTRPVMTWAEARDSITSLALGGPRSSNPHEILTGSVDARLRTYDIRMGRLSTDVLPAPIVSLGVTRDGSAVLVGCMDSRLRLLDRREGTLLQSFGGDHDRKGVAHEGASSDEGFTNTALRLQSGFSTAEDMVLVGSESDGKVRGYDVLSGSMADVLNTVSPDDEGVTASGANGGGGGGGGDNGGGNSGKTISTIAFKQRGDIWACGGVDGVVRIYGR